MSNLLIVSGPSGAGKSSLLNRMFSVIDNYYFSISTTTREPRGVEQDGKEYFFTTSEQFERDIKKGLFLEWAKVHNNYYGTSVQPIQQALQEEKLVILDIDVQGMELTLKKIPHCTTIFIAPPSLKILESRLNDRRSDTKEAIAKRLDNASKEIAYIPKYDYLIINDDLDKAFNQLLSIIQTLDLKTDQKTAQTLMQQWHTL